MHSVFGGAKATQEADNIWILQHVSGNKYLEVKKNRFDGDLGTVGLRFDRERQNYVGRSEAENKVIQEQIKQALALTLKKVIQEQIKQALTITLNKVIQEQIKQALTLTLNKVIQEQIKQAASQSPYKKNN